MLAIRGRWHRWCCHRLTRGWHGRGELDCCRLTHELRLSLCNLCQSLRELIHLFVKARALGLLASCVSIASPASVMPSAALPLVLRGLLHGLLISRCIAVHKILQASHCKRFDELVAKCCAIVCHPSGFAKRVGLLFCRRGAGDARLGRCQTTGVSDTSRLNST